MVKRYHAIMNYLTDDWRKYLEHNDEKYILELDGDKDRAQDLHYNVFARKTRT